MHPRYLTALGLLVLLATTVHGQFTRLPAPQFDWHMPDRFGLDADDDGLIDYFTDTGQISPETWPVILDACISRAIPRGTTFTWTVDGERLASTTNCRFTHAFPDEGIYAVTLAVETPAGLRASFSQEVTVQDWLIVGLGDSYGSGEGNPDIPMPLVPNLSAAVEDFNEALDLLTAAETALNTAEGALNTAQIALNGATTAHDQAQDALDDLLPEVQNIRDKMDALTSAQTDVARFCCFVGPECNAGQCATANTAVLAAGADLTAALAILGLDGLFGSNGLIDQSLNALEGQAQIGLEQAQTALGQAQSDFDANEADWRAALEEVEAYQDLVEVKEAALNALKDQLDTPEVTWQHERCHRSALSGQAQAAIRLEREDRRTSVTFVHLACSGATINNGLLGEYRGQDPQIEEAAELVGGREIDALVISIGGNDANFVPVVTSCIKNESCADTPTQTDPNLGALCSGLDFIGIPCSAFIGGFPDQSAPELTGPAFEALPARYDDGLAPALESNLPDLSLDRVYLTEYPIATRDDLNTTCGYYLNGEDPMNISTVSQSEWQWIDDQFTTPLNNAVLLATETNGWNYIGGVAAAFQPHGLCAFNHWMVRLQESFITQGDIWGTAHPNQVGHQLYRDRIAAALKGHFYPDKTAPQLARTPLGTKSIDTPPVPQPLPTQLLVQARVGNRSLNSPLRFPVARTLEFQVYTYTQPDTSDARPLSRYEWKVPEELGTADQLGQLTLTRRAGLSGEVLFLAAGAERAFRIITIPSGVTEVLVEPERAALEPGQRLTFRARALDRYGNTVGGQSFAWHTVGGIGAIDNRTGTFTAGRSSGEGYIIAVARRSLDFGEALVGIRGAGKVVISQATPQSFALHPNAPNPFNPQTQIRFELPEAARVQLTVHNLAGQHVVRLLDGPLGPGTHATTFEADAYPSGVYFYTLRAFSVGAGSFVESRKMLLAK